MIFLFGDKRLWRFWWRIDLFSRWCCPFNGNQSQPSGNCSKITRGTSYWRRGVWINNDWLSGWNDFIKSGRTNRMTIETIEDLKVDMRKSWRVCRLTSEVDWGIWRRTKTLKRHAYEQTIKDPYVLPRTRRKDYQLDNIMICLAPLLLALMVL